MSISGCVALPSSIGGSGSIEIVSLHSDSVMGGQMQDQERLFLNTDECLDALRSDFRQYHSQHMLLTVLVPLAFGPEAYLVRQPGNRAVWIKTPDLNRPRSLPTDHLGEWIVARLKQKPVSLECLAQICTRVFQTPVVPAGQNQKDLPAGVWVDTGMDNFACIQCGRCCRRLDYRDGCSIEDYRRWQVQKRNDILEWVGIVRQSGVVTACRIWMVPGTNRFADQCPWLKCTGNPNRFTCTIYDVRPSICRQYPGSRKHARMTGCRGI